MMKMMGQLQVWVVGLLVVVNVSCTTEATYQVVGTVTEILLETNTIVVKHDSIPDFMMPMTMPFKVLDLNEIKNLSTGDSVHFRLIWTDDKPYAQNFQVVGKGKESVDEDDFWEEESFQKSFGDVIDNGTFLDEKGNPVQLMESDGKFRIISFIFSRCPMPNMCPAVVFKNQYLASAFKDNPKVELIMISFDYAYDSPKVLMEKYGLTVSSYPNWHIWSSQNHSSDIMWLAKQTGFEFWGVEQNQIGHNLRTIILDPNRRWLKTYIGEDWRGKEIKEELNLMMRMVK